MIEAIIFSAFLVILYVDAYIARDLVTSLYYEIFGKDLFA